MSVEFADASDCLCPVIRWNWIRATSTGCQGTRLVAIRMARIVDLNGITSKLDYLQKLGVDAI
jgi:glycosidase